MLNWVTITKGTNEYYFLADSNFQKFDYPWLKKWDHLLEKKLEDNGIICNLIDGVGYQLIPARITETPITAPLYELVNDQYIKIADNFTNDGLDPEIYSWIKEKAKQCREEVREEQAKIFNNLYLANSFDNGLSSCIKIGYKHFYPKYIPQDFIAIAKKCDSTSDTRIIFMRKKHYNGTRICISVPKDMLKLAVGSDGKNIKKVAKKLKIFYIHVEGY